MTKSKKRRLWPLTVYIIEVKRYEKEQAFMDGMGAFNI